MADLLEVAADGIIKLQNEHFELTQEFQEPAVEGGVNLFGDLGMRPAVEQAAAFDDDRAVGERRNIRRITDARQSPHHQIEDG